MATSAGTSTEFTLDTVRELVMQQMLKQMLGPREFIINGITFIVRATPPHSSGSKFSTFVSKPQAAFNVRAVISKSLIARQIEEHIEKVRIQEQITPLYKEPKASRYKTKFQAATQSDSAGSNELTLVENYFAKETTDEDLIFDSYQAFFDTHKGKRLQAVFLKLNDIRPAKGSTQQVEENGELVTKTLLPSPSSYSKIRPSIKPPMCPFSGLELTENNLVLFRLKTSPILLDTDSTVNYKWIAASKTGVRLYLTQPQFKFPKLPAKYKAEYTEVDDVKQATKEELDELNLYANNFLGSKTK
ncbi:hypothetical protein [Parashewanella tropica]|uniref:hypothetical protein n=1 Tax=Parashewanella tropica TaxID=2547970 RepID=UPI001059676E|nr:hypothetical protein [Parashewanella tropica]